MHSNPVRKLGLQLCRQVHVGRNRTGNNLSIQKLRLHRTLKSLIKLCFPWNLPANGHAETHELAIGSNHRSKGRKLAIFPDHLLRMLSAIIQKFLKLLRVS